MKMKANKEAGEIQKDDFLVIQMRSASEVLHFQHFLPL